MAIQQFLNTHPVFTSTEFNTVFPNSQTDRNLLSRAVANSQVDHPRRELYVSRTGPYAATPPDPFEVATKTVPNAVFCYLSALQLHGVLHNVVTQTQFYTGNNVSTFTCRGHQYQPIKQSTPPAQYVGLLLPNGHRYSVTTREQTILDCLAKPQRAGGLENVLRSLPGIRHIELNNLLNLAGTVTPTVRARLGWLLEQQADQWHVPNETLQTLASSIGTGPYYLQPSGGTHITRSFASKWNLYLPRPEQELAGWFDN